MTAIKPNGHARKPTSNFANEAEVRGAMLAKLEDSGLTAVDAKKLRLEPLTAAHVATRLKELTFQRAGFKIPYFHIDGRVNNFFRFRYLEYDNARGFAKLTHANGKPHKNDVRYVQPASTRPQVFYPPYLDWKKISADVSVDIVITEGELKAACGCKHGLTTLGLGGVWSWKSKKEGLFILPDFTAIKWQDTAQTEKGLEPRNRAVFIAFDSDATNNPSVLKALNALSHELLMLGADVYVCNIPGMPDGTKCGLDDYIAHYGIAKFKSRILAEAEQYRAAEELFRLNNEVIYVRNPGLVMELATNQRMAPGAFGEHHYANRIWHTVNGAGSQIVKQAAKEWLKWPYRAEVPLATYAPGQPKFLATGAYNVWPGWNCEPQKGDMRLWDQFMKYVFADHLDGDSRRRWFEQWLAYPLQHPGVKLYQTVAMWSAPQGTGKSLIGYCMGAVYGRNFTEINDRHLQGNFNEWAEDKQFVMGDEIASAGERRRDIAERMKSMITQRELRLNPKYIPSYVVPDCINYYFTSNHPDAFFIDDTDRRFFVNEIRGKPLEREFYAQLAAYFLSPTGAAALFHYLLHDIDTGDFDPAAPAPVTSSKTAMKISTSGATEQFARELRYDRLGTLSRGKDAEKRTLFTAGELADIGNYGKSEDELRNRHARVDAHLLSGILPRFNFRRLCDGNPIRVAGIAKGTMTTVKLWAVVDDDKGQIYEQQVGYAQAAYVYMAERNRLPNKWPKPDLPTWYEETPKQAGPPKKPKY